MNSIQQAIARARDFLLANPENSRKSDSPAVAVNDDGLRCHVSGPNSAIAITDMASGIGGYGSAPTPRWLLRASLASCDDALIAMCAAETGIRLTNLAVTINRMSDDRGMFGIGDGIPPGALEIRNCIRIRAENASPERLRELVDVALSRSPVADTIRRSVPVLHEIEFA